MYAYEVFGVVEAGALVGGAVLAGGELTYDQILHPSLKIDNLLLLLYEKNCDQFESHCTDVSYSSGLHSVHTKAIHPLGWKT